MLARASAEALPRLTILRSFCRNAKRMPQDVKEALAYIVEKCGEHTKQESLDFIATLESSQRLQLETWA